MGELPVSPYAEYEQYEPSMASRKLLRNPTNV